MSEEEKTPGFEKALERLEEIVECLEAEGASLEASLKLFEEGVALSRTCHEQLGRAEEQVRVLLEGRDGAITDGPLETTEEAP